jgi:IclR family transcriptional regulator, acetate operon repressor
VLNKRPPPGSRPPYQQQVPAVRRAALVLEQLAAGREPLSLTTLSRAVGVTPSTLLAILTTLRAAGLVARHDDGRYAPGPGLVALGAAAAQRLGAVQAFHLVAGRLSETLGETVLLLMQQEDAFVLATAHEGTHALRFVPRLGVRFAQGRSLFGELVSAPDQAAIREGELEPGVWMLATPLPTSGAAERAVLAIAGPAGRLRGAAGAGARQALTAAVDEVAAAYGLIGTPPADWERAGRIEPAELDEFLRQSHVANLSYVSSDGYPATIPLWYAWDGATFWLAPRPGAEWAQHVSRDPRVSLAISESVPPLRRILVRGRIEPVDDPGGTEWQAIQAQLTARYAGFHALHPRSDLRNPPAQLFRLAPERLIAWRGLLRHPSLPAARSPAPRRVNRSRQPLQEHAR